MYSSAIHWRGTRIRHKIKKGIVKWLVPFDPRKTTSMASIIMNNIKGINKALK